MVERRRWPVRLRNGPVGLRPLGLADRAAWDGLRDRNAVWTGRWDSTLPPGSQEEPYSFTAMVRSFNKAAREGRMLPWGITVQPEVRPEQLVGQMTISGIAYGAACWAQAGYWIDEQWAGRGIVPLALAMAGDHVFGTLRLHRLEVAIRPENRNSLRVVRKLGFRYEGERTAYLHVDGAWRDHSMFALHSDEIGPGGLVGRLALPTTFSDG